MRRAIQKAANGRPRLSVFRSSKQIYAQVIDDERGVTARGGLDPGEGPARQAEDGATVEAAKELASSSPSARSKAGVKQVVFDRSGYLFHGRVKALADAAREAAWISKSTGIGHVRRARSGRGLSFACPVTGRSPADCMITLSEQARAAQVRGLMAREPRDRDRDDATANSSTGWSTSTASPRS